MAKADCISRKELGESDRFDLVCRSRSALLEGDLFCPDTWGLSASPSVAVCLIKNRCWRARFVGCMELLCACHGCMGKQAIALHGILICNMDLLSCIVSMRRAFRWSHILAIWNKNNVSLYIDVTKTCSQISDPGPRVFTCVHGCFGSNYTIMHLKLERLYRSLDLMAAAIALQIAQPDGI